MFFRLTCPAFVWLKEKNRKAGTPQNGVEEAQIVGFFRGIVAYARIIYKGTRVANARFYYEERTINN